MNHVLAMSVLAAIALWATPAVAGGGVNCGFGDWGNDEVVRLFPTYAVVGPDAKSVRIPMRMWVFEKEYDSRSRRALISAAASAQELQEGTAEYEVFQRRMRTFMVDNERGKNIRVTLQGRGVGKNPKVITVGPTLANGQYETVIRLPFQPIEDGKPDVIRVNLAIDENAAAHTWADVPVIPAAGLTVVSDIDDTFKVTNVLDKDEMMANTFRREFRAVPGMAKLYQAWASQGAVFHYVSASPWALQRELGDFAKTEGFPSAVFHLRPLRLKDVTQSVDFAKGSREYKLATIRTLLKRFPQRRFILVGDSGEKDPEVYGTIARQNPAQIQHVYVREVPGADNGKDRFAAAFRDLPTNMWTTFSDPGSVKP